MNSKNYIKILNKISGFLFLLGNTLSKLKNTFLLSPAFNIASTATLFMGYLIWYLTAHLYPSQARRAHHWYGFAEFKQQYQAAALIGLAATIVYLASPLLVPLAFWLLSLSNTLWFISEYHKKYNPPHTNHSSKLRNSYVHYAFVLTLGSVFFSLTTTILFFCPPVIAVYLIPVSTIINAILALVAAGYWLKCTLGVYPIDKPRESYSSMHAYFNWGEKPAPFNKPSIAPVFTKTLFAPHEIDNTSQDETTSSFIPDLEAEDSNIARRI